MTYSNNLYGVQFGGPFCYGPQPGMTFIDNEEVYSELSREEVEAKIGAWNAADEERCRLRYEESRQALGFRRLPGFVRPRSRR